MPRQGLGESFWDDGSTVDTPLLSEESHGRRRTKKDSRREQEDGWNGRLPWSRFLRAWPALWKGSVGSLPGGLEPDRNDARKPGAAAQGEQDRSGFLEVHDGH
ncbi:hypothetical protein EAG_07293 [Camponotus floridanus]|uniref:Uncharacterized protein n=1 Tax=Camponotus floridanus TaxID=104421 RepID=E2ATK5_CAMFO|nr:hypothetical protein EAG_07293 [Camponotus floridanus]